MDMPEASSAALLIRRPEESFAKELESMLSLLIMFLWAFNAATLVLILRAIINLHVKKVIRESFP